MRTLGAITACLVVLLTACSTTGGNTPDFTLLVSPQALTVTQGSSGQITVSVTRTGGFSGAVTLPTWHSPS